MEMIMENMSYTPFSLLEIIFVLVIVNFVNIILQDFFFSFHCMFLVFLHIISIIRKICVQSRTITAAFSITWKFFTKKIVDSRSPGHTELASKKVGAESRRASAEDLALKYSSLDEKVEEEKLSIEQVKMTMEKLVDSSEIAPLFDEEVSLEEVKEAFGLFDENKDGFIDASELRNVLCSLSFTEAYSEAECKRMISAFDDDRDGRIDFNEFVKLLEYSFS